jgi:chitin disaccharide deacetylase
VKPASKSFAAALLLAGALFCSTTRDASAQSVAERLGYKATDRLLIIHADDAGMCHSVNVATINAMEKGAVTCASIMVPCPWMPEIAEYCRNHPDADFGLHLTLTAEWQNYRWRPVVPIPEAPGLVDEQGFLHHEVPDVLGHAKPAEIEKEVRAQITRARAFGIKPTHVDSHMGTLFMGPYYPVYTRVSREMGVMPMLPYPTRERIAQAKLFGFDAQATYKQLAEQGYVFLDILSETGKGDTLEQRRAYYMDVIKNLKPGVTEIIVHLCLNDDEAKHITNSWQTRYNEYLIFSDPKTRAYIESLGIKLIGYKELSKIAWKKP